MLAAVVPSTRRRTDMQGSLGEKIGEGVFADVHAWAPGQVVKLSKPGLPHWVLQHEAQVTRAVFAAGGPAPEVLGERSPCGRRRFGIVLPRFDGPTLRAECYAHRRHHAGTSGRNPRDENSTPCRSLKPRPPPGALLAAARRWTPDYGLSVATCFQSASSSAIPCAERAPRARRRAVRTSDLHPRLKRRS